MTKGFGFRIDYAAAMVEDGRMVRMYAADGPVAVASSWGRELLPQFEASDWNLRNAYDVALVAALVSKDTLQRFLTALSTAGAGKMASAEELGPILDDDLAHGERYLDWAEGLPFRPQQTRETVSVLGDIEVCADDRRKKIHDNAKGFV
jgi:hypothetical protein